MKFLEVAMVIVALLGLLSMLVTLHEVDASPDRTRGQLGQYPQVITISHPKLVAAVCFSVLTLLGIHQLIQARANSFSCSADDQLNEDTVQKAMVARQHQECHECEVCYGGEADLHQHYKLCDKNPGHTKFIPIKEFKMEHLPFHYQDEDVVDWIRALAALTCRVVVRYTSLDRPRYFPGTEKPFPFYQDRGEDFMRTGTGWVKDVYMYTEEEDVKCECEECVRPGNQISKKARGEVLIRTVAHLVCDQTESICSECQFDYDSSDITDMSTLFTLRGLRVWKSDIKRDSCIMKFVTHDSDLLDRLNKMMKSWMDLGLKVWNKYSKDWQNESEGVRGEQCGGNEEENQLCVCISHPHGCSKQVTVGTWTHRETGSKRKGRWYKTDVGFDGEITWYRYNTPTCRGSSGAPVFSPVSKSVCDEEGRWWWDGFFHAHSEGHLGNDNNSAKGIEVIQPLIGSSERDRY